MAAKSSGAPKQSKGKTDAKSAAGTALTNAQRREAAKEKLDLQLQRSTRNGKRLRLSLIGAGTVAVVAAVAVGVWLIMDNKSDHAAPASPTTSSTAASQPNNAAGLPPFKAPADLGANCQYPPTQEKAAREAKPPRTGKVPTEPASVSASMATSQGNIGLILANNESPCTVNSFASLAGQKYFNDTKCHRLTTSPGLAVLQCGDPKGEGNGGPGYGFANEYPTNQYPPDDPKLQQPVTYPRGTLAMAHSKLPNSNGSQFFLVYKDSQLPPDYTVFGKIQDDGLATLDKIAKGGVAGGAADGPPNLEVTVKSILLD